MKRFVTTAMVMSILLTACSSTAFSKVKPEVTYASTVKSSAEPGGWGDIPSPNQYREEKARKAADEAQRQREQQERQEAVSNTINMQAALDRLRATVGKTPYVFSGSSPSGWDCSGLVRWTYQQVGITLYHGASSQMRSGTVVDDPLPGDIVAYVYSKSARYTGHVGIYVGDGQVIHSQKPGTRTRIESATNGVMNYGGITTVYVRIIPMVPVSDLPPAPTALKPIPDRQALAGAS
jgi:cell wall-associated NlpC family hydrolase